MDPLSIIVSVATLLDVGMRVSREMNSVIKTWKTATPTIFALHNEISDLNVVLDHMSHTWQTIRANTSGTKYDRNFLAAFEDNLTQAEHLLQKTESFVLELKSLSSLKMKYKWLRKNSVAEELKDQLREVRVRLGELLAAYSV
jgi:hypothetical protein